MSSVHFPPSISVPLFSPSPPSHKRQAPRQPIAVRYCWACHHGSKFSIIFSLSLSTMFLCVHMLTHFDCDVGGLSLQSLSVPRSSWRTVHLWTEFKCSDRGKEIAMPRIRHSTFSTFHMQPVSRESFCAIVHHMADFLFSHWAVCALRNEPHTKAWHTDMFVSVQTHWKQRVNVLIIPGNEIWELIFT